MLPQWQLGTPYNVHGWSTTFTTGLTFLKLVLRVHYAREHQTSIRVPTNNRHIFILR